MRVFYDVAEIAEIENFGSTVLTMGIFDGVHRGHQVILSRACELGKEINLPVLAITFDPHPRLVHQGAAFNLLASLPDRLERLKMSGVDLVMVQKYTLDFAAASPEQFLRDYVVEKLHAKAMVAGADIRFGVNNSADAQYLLECGSRLGMRIEIVDDVCEPVTNRRWSSTWVRELLAAGDVSGARNVLGYAHRIRGVVKRGAQRGRQLGYPTANIDPADLGVVPADGVYAGWLLNDDSGKGLTRLPAAISVGTNSTFGEVKRTVEAHVLGRTDLDIYDQEVVVELEKYLRPMVTFTSVQDLIAQMRKDVEECADFLAVERPGPLIGSTVRAR